MDKSALPPGPNWATTFDSSRDPLDESLNPLGPGTVSNPELEAPQ
jgi:hypothetical protein